MMEYPIALECVKGVENEITDVPSRLSGFGIPPVSPDLAAGIPTNVGIAKNIDYLAAGKDWDAEQRTDLMISSVRSCL